MTSLHRPTPTALDRVRVVLVQPSHPGNVGACARAMRVMGLRDLALVAPRMRDAASRPEALAFASGADDVLARSRVFDTLEQAVADASFVVGVSAETREFGPLPVTPERAVRMALDELAVDAGHRVALVFGPERTGLSIADVGRCQTVCSIPGDSDYCSLNLAQAVQVVAYLIRRAALEAQPRSPQADVVAGEPAALSGRGPSSGGVSQMASQAEVAGFFEHFERALVAIRFLDPAHPKKLMARMRRLFGRTRLEVEEVQLLRGVCKQAELAGNAWKAARESQARSAHPRGPGDASAAGMDGRRSDTTRDIG